MNEGEKERGWKQHRDERVAEEKVEERERWTGGERNARKVEKNKKEQQKERQ